MPFTVQRTIRPRPVTVYEDVTCQKCGSELPEQRSIPADGSLQYANNLVVVFEGGYGMFCDPMERAGDPADPEFTKVLCHECAHALADWLGIDVSNWHTHDPQSGQHPNHHG